MFIDENHRPKPGQPNIDRGISKAQNRACVLISKDVTHVPGVGDRVNWESDPEVSYCPDMHI